MTINHNLPVWTGQHGNISHCQRRCTHAACNALHEVVHAPWVWGAWGQGDAANHIRGRNCTRCGRTGSDTQAHNDASYSGWQSTAPTCTGTGTYSWTRHCSTCGRFMSSGSSTIEAHGHSMGDWTQVSPATCLSAGTQSQSCNLCGGNTQTRSHPGPSGHDMALVANCTVCGRTVHSCRHCSHTVMAGGHSHEGACVIYVPIDCPICEIPIADCEHACFVCGNESIEGCEFCPHNLPQMCECGCGWLEEYCPCMDCGYELSHIGYWGTWRITANLAPKTKK